MPKPGDLKTTFLIADNDIIVHRHAWQESVIKNKCKEGKPPVTEWKWIRKGNPYFYRLTQMDMAVSVELLKNFDSQRGETLDELLDCLKGIKLELKRIADHAETLVELSIVTNKKKQEASEDDE